MNAQFESTRDRQIRMSGRKFGQAVLEEIHNVDFCDIVVGPSTKIEAHHLANSNPYFRRKLDRNCSASLRRGV